MLGKKKVNEEKTSKSKSSSSKDKHFENIDGH